MYLGDVGADLEFASTKFLVKNSPTKGHHYQPVQGPDLVQEPTLTAFSSCAPNQYTVLALVVDVCTTHQRAHLGSDSSNTLENQGTASVGSSVLPV